MALNAQHGLKNESNGSVLAAEQWELSSSNWSQLSPRRLVCLTSDAICDHGCGHPNRRCIPEARYTQLAASWKSWRPGDSLFAPGCSISSGVWRLVELFRSMALTISHHLQSDKAIRAVRCEVSRLPPSEVFIPHTLKRLTLCYSSRPVVGCLARAGRNDWILVYYAATAIGSVC